MSSDFYLDIPTNLNCWLTLERPYNNGKFLFWETFLDTLIFPFHLRIFLFHEFLVILHTILSRNPYNILLHLLALNFKVKGSRISRHLKFPSDRLKSYYLKGTHFTFSFLFFACCSWSYQVRIRETKVE